jgi:L-amino acid N-acyltransferase YncA
MLVRDATEDDIEAITAIYNDAVANSTAIWNEVTVDAANRAAWLAERKSESFPVLVALDDSGAVAGYASFAWDGYRHTVEHSVYVRKDQRGSGIGTTLMVELIYRARTLGKHVMVAGIEASNEASIRLHHKLGFTTVGLLKEVGTKFGAWLDLAFLQLTLDQRTDPDSRNL